MTDQSNNPVPDVASVPAQALEPATTPERPITKDDLDAFRGEMKTELAKLYQGMQSRSDKFAAKMQQKMELFEQAAKANGVQLTDQDRQVYQQQAKLQLLDQQASTNPSEVEPGQVQPQGGDGGELVARVNLVADTLMEMSGANISESDPENEILKKAENGTPEEYINAVQEAITAWKARTKSSPTVQTPTLPATNKSPGLVKGVPQSNPISNITDSDDLWKLSKFSKHR